MVVPPSVLAVGAVLSGMVWYNSFFGHTDTVAKFYGVPYEEAGAHGDAAAGDKAANGAEKHHYVLAGAPGEGAIHAAPGNDVLTEAHAVPKWVKVSPFIAMLLGLGVAIWFYILNPALPRAVAENQRPVYLFLLNKWYVDEIYDAVIVGPAKRLARLLWRGGDVGVIDGFLNGLAMGVVPFFTRLAGRAQSGYIFTYAFAMVIGIAVLVTWMSFTGGAD
jgi:NADH-quinone oxidoreductase subunit L